MEVAGWVWVLTGSKSLRVCVELRNIAIFSFVCPREQHVTEGVAEIHVTDFVVELHCTFNLVK